MATPNLSMPDAMRTNWCSIVTHDRATARRGRERVILPYCQSSGVAGPRLARRRSTTRKTS